MGLGPAGKLERSKGNGKERASSCREADKIMVWPGPEGSGGTRLEPSGRRRSRYSESPRAGNARSSRRSPRILSGPPVGVRVLPLGNRGSGGS
jgi:hypothetical protein